MPEPAIGPPILSDWPRCDAAGPRWFSGGPLSCDLPKGHDYDGPADHHDPTHDVAWSVRYE